MAKSILDKASLAFFENYINNFSPTGFESPGQKLWLDYLFPYIDEYGVDNYGTAYGVVNPGQEYRVVIEAHADEIAWFVHYITDDGFIYLRKNGGSDPLIAPSKRVLIHGEKGPVRAVFGWPAIHIRSKANAKAPSITNIFLDCGCRSKVEVQELGVHIGAIVTFDDQFEILNNKYFVGRAMDNRAGGFAISQVARLLKKNKDKLPYSLYIVNSVQEEVGLRGASMITDTIQPDVAIVTDVGHDTSTPMIDSKVHGDFRGGDGPLITYGPPVHNNLLKLIIDTAAKKKIPIQREAISRSTGTDTDAFAYSNGGVVSALISFPLKYMHTTVEMVHRDDLENAIKLIYYSLLNIEANHDFRYFS